MQPIIPSNDFIAQMGHGGWGALIIMAFYATGTKLHKPLAKWGVLGAGVWALLKEFVWDAIVEQQKTPDNVHDFLSYAIGISAALVLIGVVELVAYLHRKHIDRKFGAPVKQVSK